MKKIAVFNLRQFDEAEWFERFSKELGLTISGCPDAPDMENIARVTEGCECADIITSQITRELMEEFARCGIRYLTTRTIGYDHIDMQAAKDCGIRVGNAPYGPNGVADYAVMLILMSIRNMKRILERTNIQDYTLQGIRGRELSDLTVGVIGTGRIGRTVIRHLSGFGCKLLAYDLCPSQEAARFARYVDLDTLFAESDVITLHTNATAENHHLIDDAALTKMKRGVVLVNTARGSLIDSGALIAALESGQVGAAALDVLENENGLYYYNRAGDAIPNAELALLRSFPNVLLTCHTAFYTDEDVESMVRGVFESAAAFAKGEPTRHDVSLA